LRAPRQPAEKDTCRAGAGGAQRACVRSRISRVKGQRGARRRPKLGGTARYSRPKVMRFYPHFRDGSFLIVDKYFHPLENRRFFI